MSKLLICSSHPQAIYRYDLLNALGSADCSVEVSREVMSRLLNVESRYYGLVQMREDSRTGVYVENLSEVEVHSVQDVIQLLIQVPGYFLMTVRVSQQNMICVPPT